MIRIVGGEHRGRRLKTPKGDAVRPTLEGVRGAIYDFLGEVVEGARVLDLFAGTGALGLEALSRGAASAVFVERDRRVAEVLRENVDAVLGEEAEARARVVTLDLSGEGAVARLRERVEPRKKRVKRNKYADAVADPDGDEADAAPPIAFDLITMDPPWPLLRAARGRDATVAALPARLVEAGLLAPGGWLVLEHDHAAPPGVPTEVGIVEEGRRRYGDTGVLFLRRGR